MAGRKYSFSRTFWIANLMELLERWAWYGMFMVLTLYLTGSKDTGALGFTQSQKGLLIGTVVAILYFLPTITGAIADRFGYKRILIMAYIILSSGYFMMGRFTSYASVWFVFIYLAMGAGLFKPVISATITKTTTKKTASIGFGIFYMIVNIGAFIGPIVASKLREISWNYVFLMASGVILFNLLLVLLFYKEPRQEKNEAPLKDSIITIFKNLGTVLKDVKFVIFLVIIVGFWTMYNQLFYTLPVYIEQWMDTSNIYNTLYSYWPWLAKNAGTDHGTINPEMLTNIDAFYIVIFQVFISAFVARFKPVKTMIVGFLICSIGIGLWFVFQNPAYLFISILIFAFGEMAGSPKILEYTGRIAPKDKVAMYMGTYFLPMAGGNFFAGILSGDVYARISDKVTLVQRYVQEHGLSVPEISVTFTKNDYFNRVCELTSQSGAELTHQLWTIYHPGDIWMIFSGIGLATVVLLFLYNRFIFRNQFLNS